MTPDPHAGSAGAPPADILTPLILDFLRWLAPEPRPYAEVMEAWRTACPRLTVWEDAVDQGLVERRKGPVVALTPAGRRLVEARS